MIDEELAKSINWLDTNILYHIENFHTEVEELNKWLPRIDKFIEELKKTLTNESNLKNE
jgi:hypothetical protein